MTYIVYIKTKANYYCIKFIDKSKLDIIIHALANSVPDFFLDGKKYFLNHLLEVRIFKTKDRKNYLELIQSLGDSVEREHVYTEGQNKAYVKPDYLQHIIEEVTGDLLNEKLNNTNIVTETDIVHKPNGKMQSGDIFISHSSKDKMLVDHFVEKILNLGIGLSSDDIFCTSTEGFGIKTGDDFRQVIKNNISNSKITILIISPNYKASEVCLNEMGAAWVLTKKVIPIIIEPIDFKSVGVILEPLQIARIHDSYFLDELSSDIVDELGKGNLHIPRWNKHKTEFIEFANSYKQILETTTNKFPSNYFDSFLIDKIDINQILQEAHPTKMDCRRLFSAKYFEDAYRKYCEYFVLLDKNDPPRLFEKYTSYKISSAKIPDLLKEKPQFSGGTIELAKNYVFNIDQTIYRVDFFENETSESGYRFELFTYYNNRVVFFPKPYKLGLLTN